MKVDFNGVRKKLAMQFNRLYIKGQLIEPLKNSPQLTEAISELNEAIAAIRYSIATIICLESDGGDSFEAIDVELLPGGDEDA
jgi:hypothetical protein